MPFPEKINIDILVCILPHFPMHTYIKYTFLQKLKYATHLAVDFIFIS